MMPDLLTVAEAAEWLRVHPDTVQDLCRRREIPAVKIGREWRIDREALKALCRVERRDYASTR